MIVLSNSILGSSAVERVTFHADETTPADALAARLPGPVRVLMGMRHIRRFTLRVIDGGMRAGTPAGAPRAPNRRTTPRGP
jgi:hypothetical protein